MALDDAKDRLDLSHSDGFGESQRSKKEPTDLLLQAHVTQLRLLFTAWISHFRSEGHYIKESTMDRLDRTVCRTIFDLTVRDMKVREAIGRNFKVWEDLVDLFQQACPSLEIRSHGAHDPDSQVFESGPNSNIIVQHSVSLLKDLQRLDNMLAIARNVLTAGEKVQNLAAQYGFDREVCNIVNLCIKITARGYDGDGTPAEEDRWQGVINGFKKLLITALQFLSNLVTLNERLKLMLWVELFDTNVANPLSQQPQHQQQPSDVTAPNPDDFTEDDMYPEDMKAALQFGPLASKRSYASNRPWQAYLTYVGVVGEAVQQELVKTGQKPADEAEVFTKMQRRWEEMTNEEVQRWYSSYDDMLARYRQAVKDYNDGTRKTFPRTIFEAGAEHQDTGRTDLPKRFDPVRLTATQNIAKPIFSSALSETAFAQRGLFRPRAGENFVIPSTGSDIQSDAPYQDLFVPPAMTDSDFKMSDTADAGARKLQMGKLQLLERLERAPSERAQQLVSDIPASSVQSPRSPIPPEEADDEEPEMEDEGADEEGDHDNSDDDDDDEDDEEELDEESMGASSEEDYAIPGEDGRGLLTDVPLILGPNEIEVLPMIIMSGIVPSEGELVPGKQVSVKERNTLMSMYTIRCHLLLAQENGRNLLRELLIFVAAWDLREEELYFKFMVKIMEAILVNGLMPFAYNAFKEAKDIISPAQAVIMKLLTKIFSSRSGTFPWPSTDSKESASSNLVRYDIQIVHHLVTEFRTVIIPQICALIFLQGQIRLGNANLEDFPLNLWDMERMYEGVYQYLEFFAILTDHTAWKQHMAVWEISSELITLLRELEVAIPKRRIIYKTPPLSQTELLARATESLSSPPEVNESVLSSPSPDRPSGPVPVSVERPFDISDSPIESKLPQSTRLSESASNQPLSASPGGTPYGAPIHDEPADFEWRNLKKLCVLVLSSLVWKTKFVQDQVRRFGGVTAILSCCRDDEHNPYIREHAIMCLRFLVEGNEVNSAMVHALDEGRTVDEVEAEFSPDVREWRPLLDHERSEDDKSQRENHDDEKIAGKPRRSGLGDHSGHLYVPPEVLDQNGYETFMDARGQVGLRRRASPLSNREPVDPSITGATEAFSSSIPSSMPSISQSTLNAIRAHLEAGIAAAGQRTSNPARTLEPHDPMLTMDSFKLPKITPEIAHELMNGSVAETFERIAREAKAAAAANSGTSVIADRTATSVEDTFTKALPEWMQAIVKGANALGKQQAAHASRK